MRYPDECPTSPFIENRDGSLAVYVFGTDAVKLRGWDDVDTIPGEPLVECEYGWGQVVCLYQDRLELDGTTYALTDLLYVRLAYRHALGISSARLELHFRQKTLVLRGITALEEARALVRHLRTQLACRNGELSAASSLRGPPEISTDEWYTAASVAALGPELDCVGPIELPEPRPTPTTDASANFMTASSPTDALSEVVDSSDTQDDCTRRMHTEETLLRQHQVALAGSGLAVEQLPVIKVPIRLLAEERAYYCVEATLCGDSLALSTQYTYQVRDQGLLVLTNERVIYAGRKSQIALEYGQLVKVSRLRSAIAFVSATRRELFEVRNPLECTMYLEWILRNFQQPPAESEQAVQEEAPGREHEAGESKRATPATP